MFMWFFNDFDSLFNKCFGLLKYISLELFWKINVYNILKDY